MLNKIYNEKIFPRTNVGLANGIFVEVFKGRSFAVYGADLTSIVSVESTRLLSIEENELRMDNLFYWKMAHIFW